MTIRSNSYSAVHARLKRLRGDASDYPCQHCGVEDAQEWAYDHEDPDELLALIKNRYVVRYSADINHYIPLCRFHHTWFDRDRKNGLPAWVGSDSK